MSELTLTVLRLGLLVLLWIFIFSVVGVLRTDIYGTQVSRRSQRKARQRQAKAATAARSGGQVGAAVPAGMPAPVPPPAGRGRGKATPTILVVTEGPLVGTSLPLRGAGVLIGRNPECTLVLDDDYASGRHCRVYQDSTGWMVEDLGSTNGTYIGREKLTTPRPVELGTVLRIGKTVLELRG